MASQQPGRGLPTRVRSRGLHPQLPRHRRARNGCAKTRDGGQGPRQGGRVLGAPPSDREGHASGAVSSRPRPPEWIVELGIGDGRPPIEVHAGDCHMAGHRRRDVSREEARRLLAAGLLSAYIHSRPDTRLHILDLAARAVPGAAPAQEVLPLFEAIDRRYFKPSAEAIAEVTSLLAPGGSRR
ncbi:DUF6233 domain-containing protein [Streptomyces sp. NBC_01614]|uniref:DUF6233 domain-containing protein n=1 Tax=Streptomyces sp. NBC_01614 TaxID=2975897 RepID=UPI00386561ED